MGQTQHFNAERLMAAMRTREEKVSRWEKILCMDYAEETVQRRPSGHPFSARFLLGKGNPGHAIPFGILFPSTGSMNRYLPDKAQVCGIKTNPHYPELHTLTSYMLHVLKIYCSLERHRRH
jgi:hypothetical protein